MRVHAKVHPGTTPRLGVTGSAIILLITSHLGPEYICTASRANGIGKSCLLALRSSCGCLIIWKKDVMSWQTAPACCLAPCAASARTAVRQMTSGAERPAPHAKKLLPCTVSHLGHSDFLALIATRINPGNKPRSRTPVDFFGVCGGTSDDHSQASQMIAITSGPMCRAGQTSRSQLLGFQAWQRRPLVRR